MKRILALVAVLAGLYSGPAAAVEPLSATTLKAYCENFAEDTESILSQKCLAYVGGFLDGAVVTDARVAENIVNEIEREETFTERAFRTRIYGRMRQLGPSVYAEFCIGNPVPLKEVVLHVAEELQNRESLDGVAAQDIVYASVRKHYPCQ